jgi:hypothetical protein
MRVRHLVTCALATGIGLLGAADADAATLKLKAGNFYGPGNTGVHPFNNAEVRNLILTGPLNGVIPFFNNGAAAPNVSAEVLQGLVIDGRTSDGRLINENVDTGLHLDLVDPASGEKANLMVVALGAEEFGPDAKFNLVFNTSVEADPGFAAGIRPLQVAFTTGAARIPPSLKTRMGLPGGHDFAGPFQTGEVLIGRMGDFDHDGMLDGELVLAGNAPLDLVVGVGDPIAQRRPWVSDIPVPPGLAALFVVSGVVQNFPEPLTEVLSVGDVEQATAYAFDITGRLNAALQSLNDVIASNASTAQQRGRAIAARFSIRLARLQIERGLDQLDRQGRSARACQNAGQSLRLGLKTLGFALVALAPELPPGAGPMAFPR